MAFDYSTLIKDRTQDDLNAVLALRSKSWADMTPEEKNLWLTDMKGAYNSSDLNRVGNAIADLTERLHDAGYNAGTYPKADWAMADIPTTEQINRYIESINALRNVVAFNTADVPKSGSNMSFLDANSIEEMLFNLDLALNRLNSCFDFSDELFAGADSFRNVRKEGVSKISWSHTDISNNVSDYVVSIATDGATWVAAGLRKDANGIYNKLMVWLTTDLENGQWAENEVYVDNTHSLDGAYIAWGNNTWVVVVATTYKAEGENHRLLAFSSETLENWAQKLVYSDDKNIVIYCLRYTGGRFEVVCGDGEDPFNFVADHMKSYYFREGTSSWQLYVSLDMPNGQIRSILADEGGYRWYPGAIEASGVRQFRVWYTDTNNAFYTAGVSFTAVGVTSFDVIKIGANYVFLNGTKLLYTATPTEAASYNDIGIPGSPLSNTVKRLCSIGGSIYMVGTTTAGQRLISGSDMTTLTVSEVNNRLDVMNDLVADLPNMRIVGVASKGSIDSADSNVPQCWVATIT